MGNKYQKYRDHLTSTHNESEIWAWRNVIVLSFLLNWATAEEMLWLFYLFFQSLLSASQMGDDILMFHSYFVSTIAPQLVEGNLLVLSGQLKYIFI